MFNLWVRRFLTKISLTHFFLVLTFVQFCPVSRQTKRPQTKKKMIKRPSGDTHRFNPFLPDPPAVGSRRWKFRCKCQCSNPNKNSNHIRNKLVGSAWDDRWMKPFQLKLVSISFLWYWLFFNVVEKNDICFVCCCFFVGWVLCLAKQSVNRSLSSLHVMFRNIALLINFYFCLEMLLF